ncbi:MAG TPA: dihydrolipoamide acetyltransferase family protein [Chloroflexota bacterium]|nr:dihydrolipoamide acetyltransferase family protein [Chloroflexota bacterium]
MEFRLPDLGEGTTEAELVRWLVQVGDSVKLDQPLAEVQTDKVLVELPSPAAGTIRAIRVAEGTVAQVGTVLFDLDETTAGAPAASTNGSPAGPAPATGGGAASTPAPAVPAVISNGAAPTALVSEAWAPVGAAPVRKALATPVVRRLAREHQIDLATIQGSGPAGRILAADIQAYLTGPAPSSVPAPAVAPPAAVEMPGIAESSPEERVPLRGLRRRIAENMVLSTTSMPQVSSMIEVEVSGLVALRKSVAPAAEAKGIKLSYLPFIVKAVVFALKDFPYVNAAIDDATHEIVLKRRYHIGMAAATDDGLLVPVIRDADRLTVLEIAAEIARLTEGARARTLGMPDLRGSTFTVSNFGSVGGFFATPIINPGEAAILGLGRIVERPWVVDGRVEPRPILPLSFTADHRLIDGELAMRFLNALIGRLEQPGRLLLEMR